jgi:hypothetical protein
VILLLVLLLNRKEKHNRLLAVSKGLSYRKETGSVSPLLLSISPNEGVNAAEQLKIE